MSDRDKFLNNKRSINCRGKLLNLDKKRVMGILNVTSDSFFDGGKYQNSDAIAKRVDEIFSEGADIIDVGAFSSRPGSKMIDQKTERETLIPALSIIRKRYPDVIISVDTYRSAIAEFAVKEFGADIVNDITAGDGDPAMFETVAKLSVPYIMMHMQGTPDTMQNNPVYNNVALDIIKYFTGKVDKLRYLGVSDIIIDPGFGFGKTLEHNYELLSKLNSFAIFDLPVLVGVSRKSMISKVVDSDAENALSGTIAANTIALQNGADILRVHDVRAAKDTVSVFEKYNSINR